MNQNSIVTGDYAALRNDAAMVDRSALARVVIGGNDRRSLLHGLLTNDIEALGPGAGCYAAWLTPQGRMIADLIVLELGDPLVLLVPAARRDTIVEQLEASIFTEDVTIQDEAGWFDHVGVDGPRAGQVIARTLRPEASHEASLQLYGSSRSSFRGAAVIIARTDWLGIPGYDLFVETREGAALRSALVGSGVPEVDRGVAEAVRIESGRPLFGADMDEHTIPLEAGIEDRAISFTKGCYVGQEVVVRILHRGGGRIARRLVGLALETGSAPLPLRGTSLVDRGRDVGRLTSVARSPGLDRGIALGYVARDLTEPGTRLEVASGGSAVVSALPFVEPPAEVAEITEKSSTRRNGENGDARRN